MNRVILFVQSVPAAVALVLPAQPAGRVPRTLLAVHATAASR